MGGGIVVSIHLASGATETMRGVAEARAVPGRGLEGDRYFEGWGQTRPRTAQRGAPAEADRNGPGEEPGFLTHGDFWSNLPVVGCRVWGQGRPESPLPRRRGRGCRR